MKLLSKLFFRYGVHISFDFRSKKLIILAYIDHIILLNSQDFNVRLSSESKNIYKIEDEAH